MKKILITGLGSDVLGDESIGIRLLEIIRKKINKTGVHFSTLMCGGFELLELIKDYDKLIFIDTIMTKNKNNGKVHYYNLNKYKETLHLSNDHEFTLKQLFELGKILRYDLTDDVLIIAVEISEINIIRNSMSDPVRKKFDSISNNVLKRIKKEIASNRFISALK